MRDVAFFCAPSPRASPRVPRPARPRAPPRAASGSAATPPQPGRYAVRQPSSGRAGVRGEEPRSPRGSRRGRGPPRPSPPRRRRRRRRRRPRRRRRRRPGLGLLEAAPLCAARRRWAAGPSSRWMRRHRGRTPTSRRGSRRGRRPAPARRRQRRRRRGGGAVLAALVRRAPPSALCRPAHVGTPRAARRPVQKGQHGARGRRVLNTVAGVMYGIWIIGCTFCRRSTRQIRCHHTSWPKTCRIGVGIVRRTERPGRVSLILKRQLFTIFGCLVLTVSAVACAQFVGTCNIRSIVGSVILLNLSSCEESSIHRKTASALHRGSFRVQRHIRQV